MSRFSSSSLARAASNRSSSVTGSARSGRMTSGSNAEITREQNPAANRCWILTTRSISSAS